MSEQEGQEPGQDGGANDLTEEEAVELFDEAAECAVCAVELTDETHVTSGSCMHSSTCLDCIGQWIVSKVDDDS